MAFGNVDDLILRIRLAVEAKEAIPQISNLQDKIRELEVQANRTKQSLKQLFQSGTITQDTYERAVAGLNRELGITPQKTAQASKGLFSLTNVLRTALGTFEAMAIFIITKFIGDAIKKSIDSIKQLELAIYNLNSAEKTLSRAGVDISPDDFKAIEQAVVDTGVAISEIDLTKLVANTASGVKDLGLTANQIKDLSVAAAVIAQREGKSVEDIQAQLQTGITTSGRGLKDLDIQVDAATIKQKALESQLVANEEAWNNLTAEQRQQIEVASIILLINDNVATSLEDIDQLNGSVTSTTRELSVAWENFTTALGETFKFPLAGLLTMLTIYLQIWTNGLIALTLGFTEFLGAISGGISIVRDFANGTIKSIDDVFASFQSGRERVLKSLIPGMFPGGVPDLTFGTKETGKATIGLSGIYGKYSQQLDTPTGEVAKKTEQNQEDLQKALDKMNQEILEAQIKLAQDMEDAAIDLGRKLVDIATEYARKRADAEREYSNKVTDINNSYRSKIRDIKNNEAEANAKARNDELQKEAEFQNKLLQLKEKYLMDLEEALHERDARQVLRLMKQYNLDKTQAERDRALDREKSARDLAEQKRKFARERADAEAERKAKLAEAARDYQDKLLKLKMDEEAERQAAQLAYQRKMEDLQREMHNRLSLVAAGLVKEFNLTKQGLDAIYKLYTSYYGAISQVYKAMMTMLGSANGINTTWTSNGIIYNSTGNHAPVVGGTQRFAEGGVMIADRPTTVTFGEGPVPEVAQFTPIGKNGRDVNKLFSNLSGGGGDGGSGSLEIGVTLSPDLEARIVQKSTDKVANVVTKVRGSKVR